MGWSAPKIAEHLGIPTHHVYPLWSRASLARNAWADVDAPDRSIEDAVFRAFVILKDSVEAIEKACLASPR